MFAVFTKTILMLGLLGFSSLGVTAQEAKVAIVKFTAGGKGISGTVKLVQQDKGTEITGQIRGLPVGKHGFHVHETGNLADGCNAAGGHYNPYKKHHGAPTDSERHVGDLGNIMADSSGKASFSIMDPLIELEGPTSVVGRALVIHEGEDDLGRGNVPASLQNGNAMGRIACGIITSE